MRVLSQIRLRGCTSWDGWSVPKAKIPTDAVRDGLRGFAGLADGPIHNFANLLTWAGKLRRVQMAIELKVREAVCRADTGQVENCHRREDGAAKEDRSLAARGVLVSVHPPDFTRRRGPCSRSIAKSTCQNQSRRTPSPCRWRAKQKTRIIFFCTSEQTRLLAHLYSWDLLRAETTAAYSVPTERTRAFRCARAPYVGESNRAYQKRGDLDAVNHRNLCEAKELRTVIQPNERSPNRYQSHGKPIITITYVMTLTQL